MRPWSMAIALTLGLTALLGLLPVRAETPDQARRIAGGEIVTWIEDSTQSLKTCVATGLIAAPPDKVYRAMTDYANYPKVFHTISTTKILKAEGNVLTCRYTMSPPWPLTERWLITRNQLDPVNRTVSFHMIDGNIKSYEGQLTAALWGNGKTKFTYRTRVDPGIAILPAWAITWGTRTTLPGVVRDVGNYAKSLK